MSPHEAIERYLEAVEAAVASLPAYAENYSEEILTPERANLRIRLRFDNGALLEINEALVVANDELTTLGYRYHLQRANNELVFRYDNTPHFSDLSSFPHHKHLHDKVVAASKPDLLEVLQEARVSAV